MSNGRDDTELARAHRNIAQSDQHVERQKEIIKQLGGQGRATDLAEDVLAVFESVLRLQRARLNSLNHTRR